MIEIFYYAIPMVGGGYIIYRIAQRIGTKKKQTTVTKVKNEQEATAVICEAISREPRGKNISVTGYLPNDNKNKSKR